MMGPTVLEASLIGVSPGKIGVYMNRYRVRMQLRTKLKKEITQILRGHKTDTSHI